MTDGSWIQIGKGLEVRPVDGWIIKIPPGYKVAQEINGDLIEVQLSPPDPPPEPALKVGDLVEITGKFARFKYDFGQVKSDYSPEKNAYLVRVYPLNDNIWYDVSSLTRTTIEPGDCVRHRETGELMVVVKHEYGLVYSGVGTIASKHNCTLIAKGKQGGGGE